MKIEFKNLFHLKISDYRLSSIPIILLFQTSHYHEHLSISNISLSQTPFNLRNLWNSLESLEPKPKETPFFYTFGLKAVQSALLCKDKKFLENLHCKGTTFHVLACSVRVQF